MSDLTENPIYADLHESYKHLIGLDVTSSYFRSAMAKLFFESPFIVDGHEKLYGEQSIFNFMKALVDQKAAAPIF